MIGMVDNCTKADPVPTWKPMETDLAVAGYIKSAINYTVGRNAINLLPRGYSLPALHHQAANDFLNGVHLHLTGEKISYSFITSDLAGIKPASFETYTQPFSIVVWVATVSFLVLFVLAINLTVHLLTFYGGENEKENFQVSVGLALVGIVFEQELHPQFTYRSRYDRPTVFTGAVKSTLTVWLPCALILVNSYRAMLEGHYVFGSRFIPTWSHLEELEVSVINVTAD